MAKNFEMSDLINISRKAGDKILEIYNNSDFSQVVDFKEDDSPLTMADKAAHEIIDAELKHLYPDIPVLSEEGKDIPYADRKDWEYFWLVDPLDGTKEFIKRNGEFTVNIALIHNKKPVAGIIHAPDLGETYVAQTNGQTEAIKITSNGDQHSLKVTQPTKEQCIAVRSSSHASEEEDALLNSYNVTETISKGSSLKFCMVAEGHAHLYYRHGPTMEWDTGAGQAIVEAAGGIVIDSETGENFQYNKEVLKNGSFLVKSF